jgi:hypothetical protein
VATAQTTLPAGLELPDSGVVCNPKRAICYDRYGASIGLTESFLGHIALERLTANLCNSGTDNQSVTTFRQPMVSSVFAKPGLVACNTKHTQLSRRSYTGQQPDLLKRLPKCGQSYMANGTGCELATETIPKEAPTNLSIMFFALSQMDS